MTTGASGLTKRKTSFIWDHFTALNKREAACDICKFVLKYNTSTSNLKRHILKKHPTVDIENIQHKRCNSEDKNITSKKVANDSTQPYCKVVEYSAAGKQPDLMKKMKLETSPLYTIQPMEVGPLINNTTNFDENEFDIFGRHIAAQLKTLSMPLALKAQQHIQTYLSQYRISQYHNSSCRNNQNSRSRQNQSFQVYSIDLSGTEHIENEQIPVDDDLLELDCADSETAIDNQSENSKQTKC